MTRSFAKRTLGVVLLLGAAGASIVALTAADDPEPSIQSQPEVVEAARLAMVARQQIGALNLDTTDPDKNMGNTLDPGFYSLKERADLREIDRVELSEASTLEAKQLNQFFTGAELTNVLRFNADQLVRYQGLMLEDGAPGSPADDPPVTADYVIAGGARNFQVETVLVKANEATVTGTATIWINSAMVMKDETRVEEIPGEVAFDLHLVEQNGVWKVDRYNDDFLPGSGP